MPLLFTSLNKKYMFENTFNYFTDPRDQTERTTKPLSRQVRVNGYKNPYTPGSGLVPPCLAGRETHQRKFLEIIQRKRVEKNLALIGVRGSGKTVLLESLRPLALQESWLWCKSNLDGVSSLT